MNNKLIEPRTLSGFRDFLPEKLQIRKRVISILSQVYEKYGFEPIETPTLEYQDILLGKYGPEAEKLMYLFTDQGQRQIGLKYDLTVPTARVVSQYPQIPKPFKRYQIQPVWRAEKAQKGRYREFTQCDIDIFGTTSPLADAEIISIIYEGLIGLNFKQFTIRLNSRQILFRIMESSGVAQKDYLTAISSIDKLDKKSKDEIEKELEGKGFSSKIIKDIFKNIDLAQPDDNLKEIIGLLKIPTDFYKFDATLSRGLDYYTGAIFETAVTEPKIGSITGGGRYDNLIRSFTGLDVPAVGTTLGLDRIVDVIEELNLWKDMGKTTTKVLVTIFSPNLLDKSIEITNLLRDKNINTEIYLDQKVKLDKQLKYADQKGIPYVIIIGPDEATKGLVTIKNLVTKSQQTVTLDGCIELIGR